MSDAQTSPQASDANPGFAEAVSDGPTAPATISSAEPFGDYDAAEGADLGGHTLLSGAAVPQGRRSLFRR